MKGKDGNGISRCDHHGLSMKRASRSMKSDIFGRNFLVRVVESFF